MHFLGLKIFVLLFILFNLKEFNSKFFWLCLFGLNGFTVSVISELNLQSFNISILIFNILFCIFFSIALYLSFSFIKWKEERCFFLLISLIFASLIDNKDFNFFN